MAYYGSLGFDEADDLSVSDVLSMQRQSVNVGPLLFEFCEPAAKGVATARMRYRHEEKASLILFSRCKTWRQRVTS